MRPPVCISFARIAFSRSHKLTFSTIRLSFSPSLSLLQKIGRLKEIVRKSFYKIKFLIIKDLKFKIKLRRALISSCSLLPLLYYINTTLYSLRAIREAILSKADAQTSHEAKFSKFSFSVYSIDKIIIKRRNWQAYLTGTSRPGFFPIK